MTSSEAFDVDWDAPGALSIVIQGGLFAGNIAETVNHATHWRSLFPRAEIILAISTTDLIAKQWSGSENIRLAHLHRDNGVFKAALRQLRRVCDKIRISEGAVSFPPLKLDGHGANNVNLQIAAARCGLKAATGRYVLRIRSDLVFLDRHFLAQYAEGRRFGRGDAAALRDRVLVSWLYTLNPYTVERMPFHISDWFHLGLAEDVRRIWDVPFMSFADASYHKVNRYPPEANARERMIVPRLAVEQHIIYNGLKPSFPDLTLATCVDWSARDFFVDVLADNFIICDVAAAGGIFDKYAFELTNPERIDHCISRSDWLRMAERSGAARQAVLTGKRDTSSHPEARPFPRTWPARLLQTKQGFRSGGEIVAMAGGGVLIHGPYDSLPCGRYRATLETTICRGPGTLTLRATLDEGRRVLAERRIAIPSDAEPVLELPFDLVGDVGTGFEIVCEVEGEPHMVVTGLLVEERGGDDYAEVARFDAASEPMMRRFGKIERVGIATDGSEGHLVFGPWITLPAGSYRAGFVLADVAQPVGAKLDVAAASRHDADQQVVASADVRAGTGSEPRYCLFTLPDVTERVEFRVWVSGKSVLTVREIVLERL